MLTIVTWLWGTKYSADDVRKLRNGVSRHLEQKHRFMVFCDDPDSMRKSGIENAWFERIPDPDLTKIKGCFVRLRMFDPQWQEDYGLRERIVCMDLDTVITGPLDPLFNRPETFMILQGANAANPNPYNGSIWMLRAGSHPEVWSDFSVDKLDEIPRYEFPDDQGVFWQKIPNASGWKVGSQSGIYAYQKPGWPKGDDLPTDARMVVFFGWRKPEKFKHLKWIKEHWQ